jgi:hypothetical protein
MNFDWKKTTESKGSLRRKLVARPIAEKLGILDTLRERELAMRNARDHGPAQTALLRESPASFGK